MQNEKPFIWLHPEMCSITSWPYINRKYWGGPSHTPVLDIGPEQMDKHGKYNQSNISKHNLLEFYLLTEENSNDLIVSSICFRTICMDVIDVTNATTNKPRIVCKAKLHQQCLN